ncbi:MAG: hypothetical protein DRR06_14485 [Gammaproteobacteria bacterium]|nr:MAG: hypothetical protein DRR06_14485 [Gammaproteobacteria bacterium]
MSQLYLKVRIKHLAEEAKIIRFERNRLKARQRKLGNDDRRAALMEGLDNHHKTVVRQSARASHLAYAFMRGKSYLSTECSARNPVPDLILQRALKTLKKYHSFGTRIDDLYAWVNKGIVIEQKAVA